MFKKVLFISNTHYDFKQEASVLHLKDKFEGLSKGADIFVLARGRPQSKKIWGCHFYLLPNKSFFWLLALRMAFGICLVKKIDIIVAQSPLLEGLIGRILKKFSRRRQLIVEAHGDWLEAPFLYQKRSFEGFKRKLVPGMARKSFRAADKIRVNSKYLENQVKKVVSDKSIFVFPTFTNIDWFLKETGGSLGDYLLFVGGLEPVKGLSYLLEAMKKLEAKLILVGEGSQRAELAKLVQELGLEQKVVFKGKLLLAETKTLMKNCYCLVLPSLSEGFGRVIIEAFALAKPVVASRTGAIPELVQDNYNGFLVEPKSSQQLAEKLKILLGNKDLAQTMGQRGRQLVSQKFSNQKYIERYLAMLNN